MDDRISLSMNTVINYVVYDKSMSVKVILATIAIVVALGGITANAFMNSAFAQTTSRRGVSGGVSGLPTTYRAELTGSSEVPPVRTDGMGIATFQSTPNSTSYQLSVTGLTDVRAAHIHIGEEGQNGKIVATLYNSTRAGAKTGLLSQGTITAANLQGPLRGHPLADLTASMDNGTAYVNVHTKDFPLGEIRGQLMSDSGDRGSRDRGSGDRGSGG